MLRYLLFCIVTFAFVLILSPAEGQHQYLHEGHCGGSGYLYPNTNEATIDDCRNECKSRDADAKFFAYVPGSTCACYKTECNYDGQHLDHKAYEILEDDMSATYVKNTETSNGNGFACCTNNFHQHEFCKYELPIENCKNFCDQDRNCKGYNHHDCYGGVFCKAFCITATTSECVEGKGGVKGKIGTVGPLSEKCTSQSGNVGFEGCYVKQWKDEQKELGVNSFSVLNGGQKCSSNTNLLPISSATICKSYADLNAKTWDNPTSDDYAEGCYENWNRVWFNENDRNTPNAISASQICLVK